MEFFIPGLLFFIVIVVFTFAMAPRATPMIAAVLSIVFLVFGIYDHQQRFASEYRLSTWQDGIKIYAPFLMIAGIILFIIYGMIAFFTGGSVPVPNVTIPSIAEATNGIKDSITNAVNTISNAANNITGNNNKGNGILNNLGFNKKNNNRGNNISRSVIEAL